jgi:hypothetical protein
MHSWLCGVVVVLGVSVGAPVLAQEQSGSIEGAVRDAQGGILPGVTVEAQSPALVGAEAVVTDAAGAYRFPALPPGTYEISATLQGFQPYKVSGIRLELGQVLTVNPTLQVEGLAETVQVTAEAPLIDVKQTAVTASITRDVLTRVPVERNYTYAIAMARGAEDEPKSGGFQVDGASGSENRFVIDGLDTTDIRSGVDNKGLRMEFVEEVQVKTSGYNAEYRASTGGVVNAITRSGSNAWHGDVGLYHEDNELSGDVRPELRLNPVDTTIAEQVTKPRDSDRTTEPTFTLGGPVLRDRMWFFAGYAPTFRHESRTVTFLENDQTQAFTDEERGHRVLGNVTTRLTDALRLKVSVMNDEFRGGYGFPTIEPDGTSFDNPASFPDTVRSDDFDRTVSAVIDWAPTNRLYVNVATGIYDYGSKDEGEFFDGIRYRFSESNFGFPEIPDNLKHVDGYNSSISNARNLKDDWRRIQASGDVTYYVTGLGEHALKAGVQYERFGNDVDSGNVLPDVLLSWDDSWQALDGRSVRGEYGYYIVREFRTVGDVTGDNLGFFVQDAWTVNDRLTLNLGVRTERELIPSYRDDAPDLEFSFADKFAPRVGFAYDLTGSARSKLYGFWGVYYDLMKLHLARGAFGGDKWVDYMITLDTFDWPSIQCDYPPTSIGSASCPGTFIEEIDYRYPSNGPEAVELGVGGVDPDLKPVRTQELTVGFDQELNATMSVGIRYVHKQLDRTIEDVGTLVPGVGEIYFITNPGKGSEDFGLFPLGRDFPQMPPAKRQYDGLELALRKRLADNWQLNAVYTFSRLYGNYSGLASSDESDDGMGRTDPNVERYFDGLYGLFDTSGSIEPVYGVLATDRPHILNLQASYDFAWGTTVGANQLIASGTPTTREISQNGIPVWYRGRNSDGRTEALSRTDLSVQHAFQLGGGRRLSLGVQIFNLFDEENVTRVFQQPYQDRFNVSDEEFFAGFDPDALAAGNPDDIRPDPRFLRPADWQDERELRFLAKFSF